MSRQVGPKEANWGEEVRDGRSLLAGDRGESLQARVTERGEPRAEPCLSRGVMGRRDREGGTATWPYSGLGILRAAGEQTR